MHIRVLRSAPPLTVEADDVLDVVLRRLQAVAAQAQPQRAEAPHVWPQVGGDLLALLLRLGQLSRLAGLALRINRNAIDVLSYGFNHLPAW